MRLKSATLKGYGWQSSGKYFPLVLFVFAFLLRLGLIFALETYSFPYHYSEHVTIATNILEGRGYSYGWYGLGEAGNGSFMPPAYVAVVLGARALFPGMPWLALQVFQALLSACTAMLIYFIGKEIFSEFTGMIAAFLVAVYPPALGYVLDIQSLIVEAFLVTLTVFACVYWVKYRTWKNAFVLGLGLGLAILARSNLIFIVPFLLLWMVFRDRQRGLLHFAIMIGACALILGPWIGRNYLVHEAFVLVSTNGGFNLFGGNNANATGAVYPVWRELWEQYPALARELAPLNEAARDKRLFQEGITFIQTHPEAAFWLALRKFVYFWWFKPDFIEGGVESGYPWYFGLIYIGSYAVLLGFAILGLALSFRKYKDLFIFYALFLTQTLVSMIFVAGSRYRGILEPLLIVLAAYVVVWALARLFKTPWAYTTGRG